MPGCISIYLYTVYMYEPKSKLLQGGYAGEYTGEYYRAHYWDARSLDCRSYRGIME